MVQINKIKYDRDGEKMLIEYDLKKDEKADDISIKLSSSDKPLPELIKAMDGLAHFVEDICELPKGYCHQAEIRGVSFSHSNDIMGAVITALVPISTGSVVVINTPHLPSDQYSETGKSATLPRNCVKLLETLLVEAERYVDGERQPDPQTKLDLENG